MSTPLSFYTYTTPNGRRVSIFLEELKVAYGLSYEVTNVDIRKGAQREPWYLKINPDGKIPTIVDHANGDFTISETSAILLYLQNHHDKETKFGFKEGTNEYFDLLKWLFFVHGGLAADGVAYHRMQVSDEKPPVAMGRTLKQLKQSFGVLDGHLAAGREYLVGNKYSIADMNTLPFVLEHAASDIPTLDEWPHVKAWAARVSERDQVKSGLNIP